MDPDLEFLERWRAGDQSAGQQLYARHFEHVYRFFEHKIAGAADDLTQRTFLQCTRAARTQFSERSSFRTYLFAIARNELYQHIRRQPTCEHVDLDVSSLNELVSSPSTQLGRKQEIDQLHAALRSLPVEQQTLLELHYWHELDAAALAEVFDTQPGAVRVRLHRARHALRDRLAGAVDQATADPQVRSMLDDARD